jgi:DNA-binding NarL/FixJ family response regulator
MKYGSVVLADEHAPMLEGVRGLLEELFEVVVMVAEEASLFRAIERLQPEIAVVDVSFPAGQMNVLALLRDRYPHLKVIALSIHDEPVAVARILSDGAVACVLKRTAVDDLAPAVAAVHAGETYVSPSVI